jgi:hypothetical protein
MLLLNVVRGLLERHLICSQRLMVAEPHASTAFQQRCMFAIGALCLAAEHSPVLLTDTGSLFSGCRFHVVPVTLDLLRYPQHIVYSMYVLPIRHNIVWIRRYSMVGRWSPTMCDVS